MTNIDDTTALGNMLRRLRAADLGFRVFGSEHHRYRLGPQLSEGELAAFESANGVRLPEDYRRFLTVVGNGGAGPFYGLEPLGTFGRDLTKPFPFVAATNTLTDEELDRLPDRDEYPGVLEFCHQGCAIYSYLVVNGPTYGTIWDGREDFYPIGLTFGVWYRRWLERALLALDNDRLVRRLRVGMTRADVLAEVGGDWQARPALGRPVRYFEAADIPAQLELDERDVVVKVSPWSFITARPY
ncbi:MAG TPA: SMI1/KNR4 family protein [Gemmataceae bacterium]